MSESLSFTDRILVKIFKIVNKVVPWHKLPKLIGEFNLLALRVELNNENLYDVYQDGTAQGTKATCPMSDPRYLVARNSDGMVLSPVQLVNRLMLTFTSTTLWNYQRWDAPV